MIDLIQLQAFLDKGIIQVKGKETTLFDIAGFPHYENVISNVYAYLFNQTLDHGLGTLFLDSLQELLESKLSFSSPKIHREYTTNKGGRIDLVILEKHKGKEEAALIIENKIFHGQNNDFVDYYDSFQTPNKKGVLLTLNSTVPKHSKFSNVTHEQLLDKVFQNLGNILLSLPERTLFILREFSKNLRNFKMNHEAGEYFEFYQQNSQKIHQVNKLTSAIREHMWAQIELVPELMNSHKLTLSAKFNSRLRYYRSKKTDLVFFTIFPYILNQKSPSIDIIIELNKPGIERLADINKLPFTEEEIRIRREITPLRSTWLHYAAIRVNIGKSDFENLGDFIKNAIETSPLNSIFSKIEQHCSATIN